MARFLVELYLPSQSGPELEQAATRVRETADAMTLDGVPIRYLRSTLVPEDETCFHVFEAATPEVVGEAARRAGFDGARITEAIESHHSAPIVADEQRGRDAKGP